MMRILKNGIAVALALGLAGGALAQSLDAGVASGEVGEQIDGYMGVAKPGGAGLKAQVDAINIKRREAYTRLAQGKNVPIEAVAASVGCTTLAGLKAGRAYSVVKGVWATKGAAPIGLPSQCGG
jgi:uncharacterized protein YdbL (DUF1318 family)